MRDALSPDAILGYCTNVHAGVTLQEVQANLLAHALPIKRRVSPDAPMGVGLWFAFEAAMQMLNEPESIAQFRGWMHDQGLFAYTLNGFPFGDFHEQRVKTKVYEPTWATQERYDYTLALATILSELLPDDAEEGSISTLPLGWPPLPESNLRKDLEKPATLDEAFAKQCAAQLTHLTHYLARIELDTGKCIHIDLEPEPGCYLDTAQGIVNFFERYLLGTPDDTTIRGYLRVCHDVCHSAVMFEPQHEALAAYAAAGLQVGKVQISSAVRLELDAMTGNEREYTLKQLAGFAEDRYQHQTSIRYADGRTAFYADLPDAIAAAHTCECSGGEWRIHFHVPVYLEKMGPIQTTRDEIIACLNHLRPSHDTTHFEVETYAWGVLPDALKRDTLAEGIADELLWVRDQMPQQTTAKPRQGGA